jgi:hypothetical protein
MYGHLQRKFFEVKLFQCVTYLHTCLYSMWGQCYDLKNIFSKKIDHDSGFKKLSYFSSKIVKSNYHKMDPSTRNTFQYIGSITVCGSSGDSGFSRKRWTCNVIKILSEHFDPFVSELPPEAGGVGAFKQTVNL